MDAPIVIDTVRRETSNFFHLFICLLSFPSAFLCVLVICVDSVCQKDQSTDECKHTEEKNSCGITGLNGVGSLDDFRLGNGIAYFYLFHCKVHTKLLQLFFCLASAVCVQIFVKAHTTSRETQELNTALEKVSGYTELFLADALTEDTEVFYDADWQECSKDEASYEIVIRVEPDGKLLHGTFTVQRLSGEQPEEIYSVETDRMTGTERE